MPGEVGPQGPQGPVGEAGADGRSVLHGDGAPSNLIGDNGDFYIDTSNAKLYGPKDNSEWPEQGTSLVGPQGPQGEKGLTGDTGAVGAQGAQGPQGEKGEKGDTGAQGPQGEKGDTGAQGPQGEKGEKGDTGPIGPQGEKGETGEIGPQGELGAQGPKGDPGLDGRTIHSGVGVPPDEVGLNGDFAIDLGTMKIYGPKKDGAWPTTGTSLVGPEGGKGDQGPKGDPGINGNTILNGEGVPPNSLGVNGDFALDTDTGMLYGPKANDEWTKSMSLIGPQGPKGEQGLQGEQGPQGEIGPQGPKGDTGAQGPQGLKGDTGATGSQGPKGDAGATGAQGSKGDTGSQGPAGTDGKTVLNGSGAPSAGKGVDGDFYIDTVASKIYGPKQAGNWGTGTSLVGTQGPAGTNGLTRSILAASTSNESSSTNNSYFGPFVSSTSTTEGNVQFVAPVAGTLGNLQVAINTAPGSSRNYVFSIRKNGSSTGVTCKIEGSSSKTCSSASTVTFAAGDLISLEANPEGSPSKWSSARFSATYTE